MKTFATALLLSLLTLTPAGAQVEPLRVCTWNLLDYNDAVSADRKQAFLDIVGRIRPDILVVQDLVDRPGYEHFRDEVMSVLSSKQWISGGFIDGPGTDNAFFYDPARVQLLSHDTLAGAGHAVDEWIIRRRTLRDTIHIFGAHFHPGSSEADAAVRGDEARTIRMRTANLQIAGRNYLVAGTLNAYASNDPGYIPLTYIGGLTGEVADPLHRPGDWSGNQEFADMHTSSTRLREFEGGMGGGLNDRFDYVLPSYTLMTREGEESYTVYGNDGGHFRDSVNRMPSEGYSKDVLDALHTASDHLPVFIDLFSNTPSSSAPEGRRRPEMMDLSDRR